MLGKLLLGIVLFLGLPLLGWGFDDVGGFFSDGARLVYVTLIGAILCIAAIWFPETTQNSGAGGKLVLRQRWVVRWLQAASLALAIAAPYCDRRGCGVIRGGEWLRYCGVCVAIPGFLLMLWARAALGRQFSIQVTIQESHHLITTGLYRHLRHPRYAGIVLFLAGTALTYRSSWALGLAATTLVVLLWRIRDEELLMQQEFGSEWETYRRKTWRLVPLLY